MSEKHSISPNFLDQKVIEQRHEEIFQLFSHCSNAENRYEKIIELGKKLPPMDEKLCIPQNLVKGCQSEMYLHTEIKEERLVFFAACDALISAGLAFLLIQAYQDLPPKLLFQNPPHFLEKLNIPASLSPSRANGLASLYMRMKQDVIQLLSAS